MLNDPLANALSLVKNAEATGKENCTVQPSSNLIQGVLDVLRTEGYIGDYQYQEDGKAGKLRIALQGNINDCGVIKPRYPVKREELEKWEARYLPARDFGLLVLTTTKGVMSQKRAKELGVGGKLLAYVY